MNFYFYEGSRYGTGRRERRRMKPRQVKIAVIDGQGGGVGRALVERVKADCPGVYVRALGTNAQATAAMLKGGADDGATGENAIIYNAGRVQVIMGPVTVLSANSLLGEVTPAMAAAVGQSDALKILLPSQKCRIRLAIGTMQPMQKYLDESVRMLRNELIDLAE